MTAMTLDADQIGPLLHGRIWLDLTETTSSFHRTGIQRTLAQMIATADDRGRLVPFTVAPDGAVVVHDHAVLDLLADELFAADDFEAVSAKVAKATARPLCRLDRDALLAARAVVNIEVFFNPVRAEFYAHLVRRMRERIFFLVYDIIPIGQPNHFKHHLPFAMEYFRFCLSVENIATISAFTRDQMVAVLGRRDTHNIRVITLGADTFGTASPDRPSADRSSPLFAVVGTVTDRKGHLLVLQAFRALWDKGVDAGLVFLGNPDGATSDELFEAMREEGRDPARFRWVRAPGDGDIRATLAAAWGTVYVSDGEGFGLGPLEGLHLGVPTIVRSDYPALEGVPPLGQIRVPPHDAAALEAAIAALLDPGVHRAKKAELAGLTLKTWRQFGREINDWIEERAALVQPMDDLGFATITAGWLRPAALRACGDLLSGTAMDFARAAADLGLDVEGWCGSGRLHRLTGLGLTAPPLLVADLVHHSVAAGSCDRAAGVRILLACLVLASVRPGDAARVHRDLASVIATVPVTRTPPTPHLDHLPAEVERLGRLDSLPAGGFPSALARFLVGEPLGLEVWRDLCVFAGSFSGTRRQALVKGLFTRPASLDAEWGHWIGRYCAAAVVLADPAWGRASSVCNDVLLLSSVTPPLLRDLLPRGRSAVERRFAEVLALPETTAAAQLFEALTGRKPMDDQSALLRDLADAGACREALLAFIGTHWAGLAPDELAALRLAAAKGVLATLLAASGTDAEAFVARCYASILLRRADEGGARHYAEMCLHGSSFQVIESLMRSLEARNTYGEMAVAVMDANPPHNAFLAAPLLRGVERLLEVPEGSFAGLLHKRLLGRAAGEDELNAVEARLAHGVPRERLVAEAMAGTAFRARLLDPDGPAAVHRLLGGRLLERCREALRLLDGEDFVETCFLLFRGRLPTPEETAGWLAPDGGGCDWRALLRATLESDDCTAVFPDHALDQVRAMLGDRLISRPSLVQRIVALLGMGEADFVARVSETLAGRRAEPAGRGAMAYRLSLGMPRETVILQTLGRLVPAGGPLNATFVELTDALTLAVARRLHQAQAGDVTPEAYVRACYLAVLGRPVDPDGLHGYAAVMRDEPRNGWLLVAQHLARSLECAGSAGALVQSRLVLMIEALLREPDRAAALLGLPAASDVPASRPQGRSGRAAAPAP